jgi:hypothetical protein
LIGSQSILGSVLVNGRMERIWRHKIKASRVEVVIEPFVKASAAA